jgi:hypothetical protein
MDENRPHPTTLLAAAALPAVGLMIVCGGGGGTTSPARGTVTVSPSYATVAAGIDPPITAGPGALVPDNLGPPLAFVMA